MTQTNGRVWAAIEADSKAMAQLLQEYGSSRNFGPEQRLRFEELNNHRINLVAELQQQAIPSET